MKKVISNEFISEGLSLQWLKPLVSRPMSMNLTNRNLRRKQYGKQKLENFSNHSIRVVCMC